MKKTDRALRRKLTLRSVRRQRKIAEQYQVNTDQPHRFAKRHAMTCGIPRCVICGNPRRTLRQKSYRDKKYEHNDDI